MISSHPALVKEIASAKTNSLTTKNAKNQSSRKNLKLYFVKYRKQMVPCKSTAEEVSFEWSHHRISSTDSKVRTTLHVSIIDSGNERVVKISLVLEVKQHYAFYMFII